MNNCFKCKTSSDDLLRMDQHVVCANGRFSDKEVCGKCWHIINSSVDELLIDLFGNKPKARSVLEQQFDDIQENWPILKYMEKFVGLGSSFKTTTKYYTDVYCPACTALKATVTKDQRMYFCKDCKSGGDIIAYACNHKKCSPVELIDLLQGLKKNNE